MLAPTIDETLVFTLLSASQDCPYFPLRSAPLRSLLNTTMGWLARRFRSQAAPTPRATFPFSQFSSRSLMRRLGPLHSAYVRAESADE